MSLIRPIGKPAFDLRHSIVAPKKFAVDDDRRRAKKACFNCLFHLRSEPILYFRLLNARCERGGIDTNLARDIGNHGRI